MTFSVIGLMTDFTRIRLWKVRVFPLCERCKTSLCFSFFLDMLFPFKSQIKMYAQISIRTHVSYCLLINLNKKEIHFIIGFRINFYSFNFNCNLPHRCIYFIVGILILVDRFIGIISIWLPKFLRDFRLSEKYF